MFKKNTVFLWPLLQQNAILFINSLFLISIFARYLYSMFNRILKPVLERLPENNKLERIWILAKTDFIQRYYGTKLGVVWALINPFFQLIVYYLVFKILFATKVPNFALYLFSGIIILMFFSESTSKGLILLSKQKHILENIVMNKLDLYYSALISTFMGFGFNFLTYLIFSLFFTVNYTVYVIFIPVLILNLCILILAIQLILGIIHVYFRDINHLWDMALLLFFWGSPVFYGKEVIIDQIPIIMVINPLAGILVNLRESLLFGQAPLFDVMVYNMIFAVVLLIIALFIFKKHSSKAIEIL